MINLKGVSKVIPQKEYDYSNNILKIKPNYMIHGDDWKIGHEKTLRTNAIRALKNVTQNLLRFHTLKGISSAALIKFQNLNLVTPDSRRGMLRRSLEVKKFQDL